MMFGAFAAGQANSHGSDLGRAKRAALTIFKYIEFSSKINAVDIPQQAKQINSETFKGKI